MATFACTTRVPAEKLPALKLPPVGKVCAGVTDTLAPPGELHPGKRNSLDALCERYQIDNSSRTLHGALLDAQLLAEAYLAMTRGQDSLLAGLSVEASLETDAQAGTVYEVIVISASVEELDAHHRYLEELDKACKGACVWRMGYSI